MTCNANVGGSRVSQARGRQLATGGMGEHFCSPPKRRDKRKTREIVEIPGQASRRRRLLAELEVLKARAPARPTPTTKLEPINPSFIEHSDAFATTLDFIDTSPPDDIEMEIAPNPTPPLKVVTGRMRSVHPDPEPVRLNKSWKSVIPSLVNPLISYQNSSFGRSLSPLANAIATCQSSDCTVKSTTISCLYLDRMYYFCTLCNYISPCHRQTTAIFQLAPAPVLNYLKSSSNMAYSQLHLRNHGWPSQSISWNSTALFLNTLATR